MAVPAPALDKPAPPCSWTHGNCGGLRLYYCNTWTQQCCCHRVLQRACVSVTMQLSHLMLSRFACLSVDCGLWLSNGSVSLHLFVFINGQGFCLTTAWSSALLASSGEPCIGFGYWPDCILLACQPFPTCGLCIAIVCSCLPAFCCCFPSLCPKSVSDFQTTAVPGHSQMVILISSVWVPMEARECCLRGQVSSATRQWLLQRIFIHNQTHLMNSQMHIFSLSCTETSVAATTATGIARFPCLLKRWLSLSSLWNSTEQSEHRQAVLCQQQEDAKTGVELWPCNSRFILSHGGPTGLGTILVVLWKLLWHGGCTAASSITNTEKVAEGKQKKNDQSIFLIWQM